MYFSSLVSTVFPKRIFRRPVLGAPAGGLQLPAHPVAVEVRRLRDRLWWLLLGSRLLSTLALVVGLGIILAFVDYWLRLEDRLLRLMLGGSWWAALGVLVAIRLIPVLLARVDEVSLACLLETNFPELRGQLAAAVDFAQQRATGRGRGSPDLQNAVIMRAWQSLQKVDRRQLVRTEVLWQSAIALGAALGVVAAVGLTAPRVVTTGTQRLLFPWMNVSWPQRYHLVVLRPVREVAWGSDFEVEIVDRDGKRLPPGGKAWFQWTTADGSSVTEAVPLIFVEPKTAQRRFGLADDPRLAGGMWIARREKVDRPFAFRVEAGDDRSMPWIFVNIAVAPAVARLEAEIVPPEYTGWKSWRASPPLVALEGSRVVLSGEATKAIRSATVHLGSVGAIPARVQGETSFTAELPARQTTTFWVELTDTSGLSGGQEDRWQLRVFADSPPLVAWAENRQVLQLTPAGRLVLAGEARDDLGLRQIEILFRKEHTPLATLPVYEGSPFPSPPPEDFAASGPTSVKQPFRVDQSVSTLPFARGDRIMIVAVAEDHRGQRGESAPLVLEIVSPEELVGQVLAQEQGLLTELQRALEVEKSAQKLSRDVSRSLRAPEEPPRNSLPILEGALWTQREVRRILAGSSEAVIARVAALLQTLEDNGLAASEVGTRLRRIFDRLRGLETGPLPASEEKLLSAIRHLSWVVKENASAEIVNEKMQNAIDDVEIATSHQQRVIDQLEEIIAALASQDRLRRLQQELGELIRQQFGIHRRTQNQARNTMGRPLEGLSPAERAELQNLAQEQRALGEQFQRFANAVTEWATELASSAQKDQAELARSAADKTAEVQARGVLSQTVKDLAENRLGQALAGQQQLLNDLQQLAELLQARPEVGESVRQSETAAFARELEELRRQQAAVRDQMAQAAAQPEAARKEALTRAGEDQEALRQKVAELAQDFSAQLQAEWQSLLRKAEEAMREASASAKQGQAREALAQAETAEKLLDELRKQVAGAQGDPPLAAAAELLARTLEKLVELEQAQRSLAEQTAAVHERIAKLGNLGRNEKRQVLQLAEDQGVVAAEMSTVGLPPEAALLRTTVEDVRQAMAVAEKNLRSWDTGPSTQLAQHRAVALLRSIIASLLPPEEEAGEETREATSSTPPGSQMPPPDDSPSGNPYFLLELRLLRNLQAQVHAETAALVERFGPAENWPESVRQEADRLRHEQERMAELLIELLKSAAGPALSLPQEATETPEGN